MRNFVEIVKNAKKYNKKAEIKGVLVNEMIKGGKEMIIGSKLEPGFGPVVMLGMGGIYVEVLKDLAATNKFGSEGAGGVIIVKTAVASDDDDLINSPRNLWRIATEKKKITKK